MCVHLEQKIFSHYNGSSGSGTRKSSMFFFCLVLIKTSRQLVLARFGRGGISSGTDRPSIFGG